MEFDVDYNSLYVIVRSIFASVGASAKNWLTKQAYDDGLVEDFDKVTRRLSTSSNT